MLELRIIGNDVDWIVIGKQFNLSRTSCYSQEITLHTTEFQNTLMKEDTQKWILRIT